MSRLLVSVRSAAEAEAALRGGADVIDVKEPSRGPLGRAADAVVAAVVRTVGGRRPVSAALGELRGGVPCEVPAGLAFCKFGLARFDHGDWRTGLDWATRRMRERADCATVAAAYADWQAADAPPPEDVCAYARQRGGVFLLDTFTKEPRADGRPSTLLDFLPLPRVLLLTKLCRAAGVRVALAGSLGPAEIEQLLPAEPDWFAVRGAACGGQRLGVVDADQVRRLVELVEGGNRPVGRSAAAGYSQEGERGGVSPPSAPGSSPGLEDKAP